MRFEWDPANEATNQRKHGVSFEEAREVFDDPLHLSVLDRRFTYFEERWITVGQTENRRLVVVANMYFDDNDEEIVRIISAREATAHERQQYETYE
jgi:hypothetical protein